MEKQYVVALNSLRKHHHKIAGGKGANLGELASKFKVPPGVVVSSHSFRDFAEHNGLSESIGKIQKSHDVELASKISGSIVCAAMPRHIENEIISAISNLKNDFVAVRSSAVFEDSGEASWAGQLETYTNIPKAKVLEHVKKCWASLFSDRALTYYHSQEQKRDLEMAVVVQEMLAPQTSGICFTANPLTGSKDEVVIEAGFGLGEAVVSGQITPDFYVVNKNSMTIEKVQVNRQEKMLGFVEGKTAELAVPEELVSLQKLAGKNILELAQRAVEIERHYGFPQDIEWALENNELYFLQARPITTLRNKI